MQELGLLREQASPVKGQIPGERDRLCAGAAGVLASQSLISVVELSSTGDGTLKDTVAERLSNHLPSGSWQRISVLPPRPLVLSLPSEKPKSHESRLQQRQAPHTLLPK